MKKYFFAAMGVTFGIIMALAILGGGVYWWAEVRIPAPPKISVELDGFPDTRKQDGKEKALVRIVVTNNDDSKISINDAYLYVTRVSDGARADIKYKIDNMVVYPKEKLVEVVETWLVKNEWIDLKDSEEFDTKDDYLTHKEKWIEQIKKAFRFNFTFLSDKHNIRISLNTQEKIAEIESKDELHGSKK